MSHSCLSPNLYCSHIWIIFPHVKECSQEYFLSLAVKASTYPFSSCCVSCVSWAKCLPSRSLGTDDRAILMIRLISLIECLFSTRKKCTYALSLTHIIFEKTMSLDFFRFGRTYFVRSLNFFYRYLV